MSKKKSFRVFKVNGISLNVKGMHCKSCVDKIESKIGSMKGVKSVKANLAKDNVHVTFESNKTDADEIKSEIRSIGYSVDGKKGDGNATGKQRNYLEGIAYGLVPHIGCITFIIGSVLGVTFLMEFFRPLLMNRWFFYILFGISIMFATISSLFYLRKNGLLSFGGARKKWQYLSVMYGSTAGVNLALFLLIFPLLANLPTVSAAIPGTAAAGLSAAGSDLQSLQISVDIPCSGHAPLITGELKKIGGVSDVKFSFPNIFDVKYDPAKTSRDAILSIGVFSEYPATVISEDKGSTNTSTTSIQPSAPVTNSGTSDGGCCGGGGSCDGSGGGCGCSGGR